MSGGAQVRLIDEGLELRAQRLRGERVNVGGAPVERFLSKPAVAEFYDVTTRTVDEWCRRGMPWHQRGSRRKFRLSETEGWLAGRGVG